MLLIRKFKYTRLGWQFGGYLIWYSVGRFIFEGMRDAKYNLMLGNVKIAQLVSIVVIIILLQARKPKLTEMYNDTEKVEMVYF